MWYSISITLKISWRLHYEMKGKNYCYFNYYDFITRVIIKNVINDYLINFLIIIELLKETDYNQKLKNTFLHSMNKILYFEVCKNKKFEFSNFLY